MNYWYTWWWATYATYSNDELISFTKSITVPFTQEELITFKNVYEHLIKETEFKNVFEWLSIIPWVSNWDMIL